MRLEGCTVVEKGVNDLGESEHYLKRSLRFLLRLL